MSHIKARLRTASTIVTAALAAVLLTGCGFGAQTLQPYTPAEGVNLDVGTVKVRNLVVVADEDGNGILSGSLVSSSTDALAAVHVTPLGTGNAVGTPLTVTPLRPVVLPAGELAVLTDPSPAFAVAGDGLTPGQTVTLSLVFESGATGQIVSPVLSNTDIAFASVGTAIPTPSAPTATPSA